MTKELTAGPAPAPLPLHGSHYPYFLMRDFFSKIPLMNTFKEIKRIYYWLIFLNKTKVLKTTNHITEIGRGDSNRIQHVLALRFFRGNYISVDINPTTKNPPSAFIKKQAVTSDYFKLKIKTDLIIFDHSIDDILALEMTDKTKHQKYTQIMDNISRFDYKNQNFMDKIHKILTTGKKLLKTHGHIAVSNYPTKYDQKRKTTHIINKLLPVLAIEAKKTGYKIKYSSKRFLLLQSPN